jgi:hypothetical protein
MEIRADVGTSLAAGLADEPGFQIGQPDIIRTSITADCGPMAAAKIRAINQETAHASGTHLGEGDFLAGDFGHHRASKARPEQ